MDLDEAERSIRDALIMNWGWKEGYFSPDQLEAMLAYAPDGILFVPWAPPDRNSAQVRVPVRILSRSGAG